MEESTLRTQKNCCRLCLAPDNECISILNSYAADKEPLIIKIFNCVSIKITSHDHLSLRICHACISYLNSWQSFKNRCIASQTKQRAWMDTDKRQQLLDNNVSISTISTTTDVSLQLPLNQQQQQQQQHYKANQEYNNYAEQNSNMASSILDGISCLKKRKSLTVYPIPAVEIKDEPIDIYEDYNVKHDDESDEMMDPTMFLERTEEEGDEPLTDTGYAFEHDKRSIDVPVVPDSKEASCRACNLKFSTRANARRHERNLHPNLFELSTSTPNSTPITKPTPALAAALEMQRAATTSTATSSTSETLLSQQKYRQEVVNAFNKCEMGGFDYDHPEKYQHLLTDEKIVFLQQNEEFLKQYQNMTCRCCKKFYSTYKNFMAHMRKKYSSLPRNLCFNCLKLNDSKALFISHLKRRNCINLYKVLHSLMTKNAMFASAVAATAAAAPEKLRAKELLVNKMYECKLCPKKFRLKLDFRSHVYEEHADAQKKDAAPSQCNYCGVELEEPAERKRHHNNMDCIVCIRCLTCDEKFDNYQKFLDHAYAIHLTGFGEQTPTQLPVPLTSSDNSLLKRSITSASGNSGIDTSRNSVPSVLSNSTQPMQKSQYFSRMPQACPICGQQYNNYNNVLRHMESKHPDQLPQTYKCVKCSVGYPRLSNLREHMVTMHASDKARHTGFEYIVNADAIKMSDGRPPNVYTGRYDYVMKDLMSITNGGAVDDDDNENTENAAKKMRLDNSQNSTGGGNMYSSLKECPICNAVFNNNIGLSNHMRSHTAAAQSAAMSAINKGATISSGGVTTPSAGSSSVLGLSTQFANSEGTRSNTMPQRTPAQQAIFRRSLEQAADRRFRRMRCRICQRRFSSKKSYRFHMLNDHQIRNVQFIKCKLCDAEFAYEKGLKVHMFKIHNTLLKVDMIIKQFECEICSIVYRTEEQLRLHKQNVHGGNETSVKAQNEILSPEANSGANSAEANQSGHSMQASTVGPAGTSGNGNGAVGSSGPLYWYQCKYCPSNFNANKKLAIHINSHDKFDSNDYSCKDCGNVYSGRKSLWVHRYKKHPQIPQPSECEMCKKVFFDRQMLDNHIPTCNRKPITSTGAAAEVPIGGPIYRHKTGDDDEELSHDAEEESAILEMGGKFKKEANAAGMKIKLPEVACTICAERFTDQELFAKHIQMHERELYTDNPLAAMFDTGPADPNQFYLDRVNDNGEYACDLCPKTFTQMTAFKVHRKWHFRGDSKQNPAEVFVTANANSTLISRPPPPGLQAVGLMPRLPSKSRKCRRELKCEYCPSTFITNNNLRRHIFELHKEVIGDLPVPPKIEIDENRCCHRCNLKFESKLEWIEHKVADARIMKPFGPYQWGCDLCGAYVSRKEKLINHIYNHMKEKVIMSVEQQKEDEHQMSLLKGQKQDNSSVSTGDKFKNILNDEVIAKEEYEEEVLEENDEAEEEEEDEINGEGDGEEVEGEEDYEEGEDVEEEGNDSETRGEMEIHVDENANDGQQTVDAYEDDDLDEDENENDEMNDDETNESKSREIAPPNKISNTTMKSIQHSTNTTETEDSPGDADDDDDGIDEDDDDEDEDADEDTVSSAEGATLMQATKTRFNCDLCSGCFTSQQELQKHVKMHFLNGPGSVTLTEIKSKHVNNSRSSSSDAVTVSSS